MGSKGHLALEKKRKCIYIVPFIYYTVSQKKENTKLMAVTLSFFNRFSKFFHWHTRR